MPAIRAAVAAVAREAGASAYGVAGQAPATYDISRVSDHDLLRIFPVAIVVIAILLALVMRSLVAPVYLIASVALLGRWNWWPSRHGVAAGEVSEGQQLAGTCGR